MKSLGACLLSLLLAACGGESGEKTYGQDHLVGTWKPDFEESWTLSRELFLKDTLRGSDAYPEDPAEKEAVVRKEMEGFLGSVSITYGVDGSFLFTVRGAGPKGTFKVVKAAGETLSVEAKAGRSQDHDAVFVDDDTIRWVPQNRKTPTFLLRRQ